MERIQLTENDHIQGSASAPVILVEYADYQCPYCGQAYPIVKKVQKKFGEKLAFVFRNYPLPDIHPYAVHAAIAAETAARQGKFWEMHDIIMENQRHLDDTSLIEYAREIGLDIEKFKQEFGNEKTASKLREDIKSGNKAGVRGTPSFFVNGKFFTGNWSTSSDFEDYIESFL